MSEKRLYYKYSEYLKEKYRQKVYKLPVNLPITCPNRDGRKGYGGCIFCGEKAAGHEAFENSVSIRDQLICNGKYIREHYGANMFEVFFQNFTNTYMPTDVFREYVREALSSIDNVAILSVSTRPDCIAEEYLDILREEGEKNSVDITIELGLQSVNAKTLKILNRRHTLSDYIESMLLIKKYGFQVCTHIISTLPWDSGEDIEEAARIISVLGSDSVKLHSLYIEHDTVLEQMYNRNEFELVSLEEYIKRTCDFLECLNPGIAVQRLNARVPKEVSTFANWGRSHWVLTDRIVDELSIRNSYQGKRCDYGCRNAVRKFLD